MSGVLLSSIVFRFTLRSGFAAFACALLASVQGVAASQAPIPVSPSIAEPYQSIWALILDEAGINVTVVEAPFQRLRRRFAEGTVLMDCCTNEVWRDRPEEQAVQRFSDVIMISRDRWLLRDGVSLDFNNRSVRQGAVFARIRGFVYNPTLLSDFSHVVDVPDYPALLRMVAHGRADAAMMNEVMFERINTYPDLKMGTVSLSVDLRVRVHQDVAHVLPAINAAIARIKADGRLGALVRATRGPASAADKDAGSH